MSGKPRIRIRAEDVPSRKIDAVAHDAASVTDHTIADWLPFAGSADADLLSDLDIMVPRSRDLARNDGTAAGALQTYKDNIVGSQLRLSANPDYRLLGWEKASASEWADKTEGWFRTWAESCECDAGNSLTLLGQTLQAIGGWFLNGDALALPVWKPRDGANWNTRLMAIESDRLATPPHLEGNAAVRRGVHIDEHGAPLGYWIRRTHPGDAMLGAWSGGAPGDFEYVPAFTPWGRRRVIHLHDKERTGQSRGKPIVSAIMRDLRNAGKYTDAALKSAIVNALVAAFIESDLDPASVQQILDSDASQKGQTVQEYWKNVMGAYRPSLRGGAVLPLPIGAKMHAFDPKQPNAEFGPFMETTLRRIAAGINLPYELLAKDFSKTNYSSARAALLEAWRFFTGRRRWLIDNWLAPIYELWMEEAVQAGVVEAPDFYRKKHAYLRSRWIMSGRGWVDPVKEPQGSQVRLSIGMTTLEDECAEQGKDWREVAEQRAIEYRYFQELGIPEPNIAAIMGVSAPSDAPSENNSQEAA